MWESCGFTPGNLPFAFVDTDADKKFWVIFNPAADRKRNKKGAASKRPFGWLDWMGLLLDQFDAAIEGAAVLGIVRGDRRVGAVAIGLKLSD